MSKYKPYEGKNYKKASSSGDCEEWEIVCPINAYSVERNASVGDSTSRTYSIHLTMVGCISHPHKIAKSYIEIKMWQSNEDIVCDDIDDDYVGVGAFKEIYGNDSNNQLFNSNQETRTGSFNLCIPVDADTLQKYADMLLRQGEGSQLYNEVHATIAGLLNSWNGKGNLCVTSFSLVLNNNMALNT